MPIRTSMTLVDDGSVKVEGGKIVIRLDLDGAEWLRDHLPANDGFTGLMTAKIIEAELSQQSTAGNTPCLKGENRD